MSLSDAVIGLKAYKETEERMEQLWRNLDGAVVSPRMDKTKQQPAPCIETNGDELTLAGSSDGSVASLLSDLEVLLVFVAQRLPTELLNSLVGFMMPDLTPRLIQQWLNPAVPSSLSEIPTFQSIIQVSQTFCTALETNGYTGFDELKDWVSMAHMTWLGRCRETALDKIRTKLTSGIGEPKKVEKIEKHMVTVAQGKELATTGAGAAADTNDWGAAWDDAWDDDQNQESEKLQEPGVEPGPKEDDGADAWGWDDDDKDDTGQPAEAHSRESKTEGEDDTGADAWGWGDEDATAEPEISKPPAKKQKSKASPEAIRELVLKETYYISCVPEPVLELMLAILEDGATLTKGGDEYQLVASTAPGLFSLPTLALALFRAISPYYYSLSVGGNMYVTRPRARTRGYVLTAAGTCTTMPCTLQNN
jgi:centromere/kinetochore protein ZW10